MEEVRDVCLVKATWVTHIVDGTSERRGIYSIDIHPNGDQFLTGGGDGKVKLWSMFPVMDEEYELDGQSPKLLFTGTSHTGSVNCVRWSHSGDLFVSGSSDSDVIVWKLQAGTAHVGLVSGNAGNMKKKQNKHKKNKNGWDSDMMEDDFDASGSESGSINEKHNIQNWQPTQKLTNHSLDVQDIAWSPSDHYLATAGADRVIYMFKSSKDGFKMYTSFDDQHQGSITGLGWDPMGQYLASQSADGSVCVWDVINCTCCTRITQDFVPRHKMMTRGNDAITRQECLMRPDWSPDGEYLTTSFGVTDTSCFVSPIYKRGTWQRHGRAVGHSMPTTVAKFNPRMFGKSRVVSSGNKGSDTSKQSNKQSKLAKTPKTQKKRTKSDKKEIDDSEDEDDDIDMITNSNNSNNNQNNSNKPKKRSVFAPFFVCAVGSMDCGVSIFATHKKRPITTIETLSNRSVLDMSWNPMGNMLLCSTHDGFVFAVVFAKNAFQGRLTPVLQQKQYITSRHAKNLQNMQMSQLFQMSGKSKNKHGRNPKYTYTAYSGYNSYNCYTGFSSYPNQNDHKLEQNRLKLQRILKHVERNYDLKDSMLRNKKLPEYLKSPRDAMDAEESDENDENGIAKKLSARSNKIAKSQRMKQVDGKRTISPVVVDDEDEDKFEDQTGQQTIQLMQKMQKKKDWVQPEHEDLMKKTLQKGKNAPVQIRKHFGNENERDESLEVANVGVLDYEQNLETLPLDELKKVEFAGFGVATGSRPSASKTGATSSSSKHSRHAMKITDHFQSASPQPSPVGAQRGRVTSTNKSTRSHAISNKSSSKLNQNKNNNNNINGISNRSGTDDDSDSGEPSDDSHAPQNGSNTAANGSNGSNSSSRSSRHGRRHKKDKNEKSDKNDKNDRDYSRDGRDRSKKKKRKHRHKSKRKHRRSRSKGSKSRGESRNRSSKSKDSKDRKHREEAWSGNENEMDRMELDDSNVEMDGSNRLNAMDAMDMNDVMDGMDAGEDERMNGKLTGGKRRRGTEKRRKENEINPDIDGNQRKKRRVGSSHFERSVRILEAPPLRDEFVLSVPIGSDENVRLDTKVTVLERNLTFLREEYSIVEQVENVDKVQESPSVSPIKHVNNNNNNHNSNSSNDNNSSNSSNNSIGDGTDSKSMQVKPMWKCEVPGRVTCVGCNQFLTICGTQNGELLWYSSHGTLILPAMQLDSEILHLYISPSHKSNNNINNNAGMGAARGSGGHLSLHSMNSSFARSDGSNVLSPLSPVNNLAHAFSSHASDESFDLMDNNFVNNMQFPPMRTRLLDSLQMQQSLTLARMRSKPVYICVLTRRGNLTVWKFDSNISGPEACLKHVKSNICHIVECAQKQESERNASNVRVEGVYVTQTGTPILMLNNGMVYYYQHGMDVWLRVSDHLFWSSKMRRNAMESNANARNNSNEQGFGRMGMIGLTCGSVIERGKMCVVQLDECDEKEFLNSNESVVVMHTLSHLEQQISVSSILKDAKQFEKCVKKYAQKLIDYQEQGEFIMYKMQELCFKLVPKANNMMNMNIAANGLNVLPQMILPGNVKYQINLMKQIAALIGKSRCFEELAMGMISIANQLDQTANNNLNLSVL